MWLIDSHRKKGTKPVQQTAWHRTKWGLLTQDTGMLFLLYPTCSCSPAWITKDWLEHLYSQLWQQKGGKPDACFPLPSREQACGQRLASMRLFTTDACFPGTHTTVWPISQAYCGYILGCVLSSLLFLPLDVASTQELWTNKKRSIFKELAG